MQILERQSPELAPREIGSTVDRGGSYRLDIDGLRAVAVVSVIAFHAGLPLFPGGYVGVDIFFVISGYLIGGHVYKDVRHGRFSIARFYERRAKRILPALFVILLFCCVASLFLLSAPELIRFGQYVAATTLSVSNVVAWLKSGYFSEGSDQNPLLMTWSLGVEEQFYLVLPLLMIMGRHWRRRTLFIAALIITIVSFVLSILGMLRYQTATFFLLPTRAWELAVGVLLSIYETDRRTENFYGGRRWSHLLGLVGLGLLFFAVTTYSEKTAFPGLAAVLPVFGSALILMAPAGWINRTVLSSRPLVFIGAISYSLYLWHWPLLSFARIASDRGISSIAASLAIGAASLLAYLSYRFVEQPFRKARTPTSLVLKKYGVLCVLMLVTGLTLVAAKGFPQRFPSLYAVEQRSQIDLTSDPCLVLYGRVSPNFSSHCVPASDPRLGVALLGDSHAGAIGEALRESANQANYKFYEMAKTSCPTLLGITRHLSTYPDHALQCARFNERSISFVQKDPRVKLVILTGYWSAPFIDELSGSRYVPARQAGPVSPEQSYQNFQQGLAAAVAALEASGKRVVIMKDDPHFAFDPVRRVRSDYIPLRGDLARALMPTFKTPGSASADQMIGEQNAVASSIIDRVAGSSTEVFDLGQNLCRDQSCLFYSDGLLLYEDAQHLSLAGARRALLGFKIREQSLGKGNGT